MKSRRMRWAEHVARMGGRRGVYRVLVGEPGGERLLGRPRRRRGKILRCILRKWDVGGMDWMELAQDRDRWRVPVSAEMNHLVP